MQSSKGLKSSELFDLLVDSLEQLSDEKQESDAWNNAIDELLSSMSMKYIDMLTGEAAFLSNAIKTGDLYQPSEFYTHCMLMIQDRSNSPNGEREHKPRRPLAMPDKVCKAFLDSPGILFLATCDSCAYQFPTRAFRRCPLCGDPKHRWPGA